MGQSRSNFDVQIKNAATERFTPITDPVKVKAFFSRAESIRAGIVLWTENKKLVVKGKLIKIEDAQKRQFWVDFQRDQKEVEAFKILIHTLPPTAFLMVFFPKQVAFAIKVKTLKHEDGNLLFELDGELFRAQRRKDLRLTIPKAYSVYCVFPDPNPKNPLQEEVTSPFIPAPKEGPKSSLKSDLGEKDDSDRVRCAIYDISVGGLSFTLPPEKATDFKVGQVIRRFKFTIRNYLIHTEVTIRNSFPTEDGNVRIGCSFNQLSPKYEDFLAFYITEHAMQVTSNYY